MTGARLLALLVPLDLLGAASCGRVSFDRNSLDARTPSCAVDGCEGRGCGAEDPLATGLSGWWPFDDGTGTVAHDLSGNERDGVLLNGTTWIAGRVGGAVQLDGIDDHVRLGTDPSLDLRYPMTMAAWVRADELTIPSRHSLIGRDDGLPARVRSFEWGVGLGGDVSLTTYPACVTDPQLYTYGGAISIGAWAHLTMTLDAAGNAVHFIDGIQVNAETLPSTATCATPASTYLGGTPYGPYLWSGAIDEVRIYDRAIGACEVEGLQCAGRWHCTNARQDCGESDVDLGADCS